MPRFNKGLLLELLCVSFALGGLAQYFDGPSVLTPIEVVGRVEFSNVSIMFDWSGIHFTLNFTGCGLRLQIFEQQSRGNYYSVYVDGRNSSVLHTATNQTEYDIVTNISNSFHSVTVVKRTEALFGEVVLSRNIDVLGCEKGQVTSLKSLLVPQSSSKSSRSRRIEFLGDSIPCAYGILGKFPCNFSGATQNIEASFVSLTSRNLSSEYHVECWSGKGVVRNYGSANKTSPDPFPIYWPRILANNASTVYNTSKWIPDVVVVHLGGNDYSTSPTPSGLTFLKGYWKFLESIFSAYPNIQLFHVVGTGSSDPFELIKTSLEIWNLRRGAKVAHYVDCMNILTKEDYGCDYHPNTLGHEKIASILTPAIKAVMGW